MSIEYISRVVNAIFLNGVGSGGTEVTSGGYKYHTFTSSGTFTVTQPGKFEVLVISGGGAGASSVYSYQYVGSGGGAGGLYGETIYLSAGSHVITVGAGGASAATYAQPGVGNNSSIGSKAIAVGGGAGYPYLYSSAPNPAGGCGGGQAAPAYAVFGSTGTLIPGGTGFQGYDGGAGYAAASSAASAGGGGGLGEAGHDGTSGTGGAGGNGTTAYHTWLAATSQGVDVSGTRYIGGGGGSQGNASGASGGLGGGGAASGSTTGTSGTSNTGGGGGAGYNNAYAVVSGGSGGSGLVIIRYAV